MKILVICQYYYPEPFRITDLCEEMVERGHEVTVITGIPNYPEGVIYKGYKNKEKRNEIINGVKVHRSFTIERKKGTIYRFLNYYSFALSSSINVVLNKFKTRDGEEYDVIFVNQLSPIMMAYAGMIYKRIHHKKLVMYCLDLWPASLIAGGIRRNSIIYRIFHGISRGIYRSCDQILVTSRMFKDYISCEFDIKKEKIAYLPQYAERLFEDIMNKKIYDSGRKSGIVNFVFAGNVGEVQSVQTIIKSAEKLENHPIGKNAVFHILGSGTDLGRIQNMAKDLKNVIFYGRRPVTDMPRYFEMADAMLITLGEDEILSMTLPGKVQSYMAAGKPIIGAINGETQNIIQTAKCGYVGPACDSDLLCNNVCRFMNLDVESKKMLGIRAREYYKQHFSRAVYMDNIEDILIKSSGEE